MGDSEPLRECEEGSEPAPGTRAIVPVARGGSRKKVFFVPGYLGENWKVDHGPHPVSGDLANQAMRAWAKYAADFALVPDADIFVVNWPSFPTLERILKLWTGLGLNGNVAAKVGVAGAGVAIAARFLPGAKALLALSSLLLLAHWDAARRAADRTGEELAAICESHDGEALIIGHSLGGRVALRVREFFRGPPKRIPHVVAFAPALSPNEVKWDNMKKGLSRPGECFHSKHDQMLALAYGATQLWLNYSIGLWGVPSEHSDAIRNIDVSVLPNGGKRGHAHYVSDWVELLRAHSSGIGAT